ncbi:uncharacterized protein LOC119999928 isoform X1 [Tripterygium wilfordii]|uniref:uncharacterized protein LOC119999928 isoform X1 n=1 Tax=Tripterygium wilfordii TaxID=458696 RepID=UPI0018F7E80A|nr:uncharacterized protein LOC119999928 isoform X1 [Tripterygium wilfordii]
MSSNAPVEDPSVTETDEETVALRKKRLRRVSFADREITSVHIFNRDEDYESPPDFEKNNATPENEVVGLFKDLADSDDFRELSPNGQSEDDEVAVERNSFLRPIGSPSPGGSSIVGSATSNDEENFFGPVSASFIRPGRLSGSAASDENHDITMDSTAFSMHFRSLAKSDSGGDIKTPTGVRLAFEDKTPAQTTTPSDPGSSMVITKYKKPVAQSSSSLDRVSGRSDSFDMSLVEKIPNKYDYGKLSPKLQAILAEGIEDLHVFSLSDYTKAKSPKGSLVPSLDDNGVASMGQKDDIAVSHSMSAEEALQPGEVNGSSVATTVGEITHDYSLITNDDPTADASIDHQIRTPDQHSNQVNKERKTAVRTSVLNDEFSAMNKSTPPPRSIKFSQLDLSLQHESGHRSSNGDQMKETYSSKIHNSAEQHESPDAGSIYSLSAKRRHIFQDVANSSQYSSFVTASPKQTTPILGKEMIKGPVQVFSIPRISRAIEPSPCSALKDGMRRLKLRSPLPFSSETSPMNTPNHNNNKFLQSRGVDCPDIDPEKQFSFDLKSSEQETVICINSDGIGHLNNGMSQNKETKGHAEDGDSPNLVTMTAVTSPLFSALSQNEIQDVLTSRKPSEGTLDCRSDSSSMKLAISNEDDEDVIDPPKFASPLIKRPDQKLSSSVEYQSSISSDFDQHYKSVSISPGQDGNTVKNANPGSPSAEITDRLGSFVEGKAQSSSSLLDRQSSFSGLQNVSKIFRSFQSPSRDKVTANFNQGEFREGLPEKGIETPYDGSTSMYGPKRTTKEPLSEKSPSWKELTESLTRKDLTDSTRSLGMKDPHSAYRNYNFQSFIGKDISSESNFIQHAPSDSQSKLDLSRRLFSKKDVESSSGWKRKNMDPVHGDGDNDDNSRAKRNPKICKRGGSDSEFMIMQSDENDNRTEKIVVDITLKHWTNVSSKFSADTKELLSPLTDKLNIRAIDRLEDIVVHLQKVKIWDLLCSEIRSQKINNQSSNAWNKRVSETRVLLYKIAYEKAKLKLLYIKYDKVLKRMQQLDSAVQESRSLRSICTQHRSLTSERNTQIYAVQIPSMILSDKVAIMRHDVEALDKKIENLTESVGTYYKRKAVPSCSEIIVLLNDHLKKKSACRLLHQDLQLWEVGDVEKGNGHYSISLNYQGFICKRLTVNSSPTSIILISDTLNALNIMKNFPNMNALAAFSFVFNAETTKKYAGSKILARDIQTTSSVLCNLLDVFREVQLAQIEVRSVTNTNFFSPSAEQLDLELRFTDFSFGRKVSLTLDMTCLKRGIYPSENLAYQLQISNAKTLESLDQRFAAEIDHLKVGYSRIIRLCKCVSQVMQSLSR